LLLFSYAGWQFDGFLAAGDNEALGLRGNDWECPILSRLPGIDAPPALASLPALNNTQQQQELDAAHAAAAAAATVGPSASQQQLLLHSKHKRSAGGCSMSSFASSGSLLGVGHYPAGFAAGCDSDTISSSVSDCSPASEVSSSNSSSSSVFAQQGSAVPHAISGCFPDVAFDRATPTPATCSVIDGSNTAGSSAVMSSTTADMCGTTPAAAALAASGAVVPLIEPVLAAATAATEAAAAAAAAAVSSSGTLSQQITPNNLYAWLEQTPEPSQAAAAAATVAADVGLAVTSGRDDATVLIHDVHCSSSSSSSNGLQHHADSAAASLDSMPDEILQDAKTAAAAAAGSVTSHSFNDPSPSSSSSDWFFCISPEACNFPITWWLGRYDGQRFDVAGADGPHRLDLGTTLYAATLWQDPQVCCVTF
jgi:sucrose-6-phosphate hydrolase SacC (GH32 family)